MAPLWRRRREPPPGAAELSERLDSLGLFAYLEPADAEAAKAAFARKGIDALWTQELGRSEFAGDAEDLAEGGVGDFLESLRPLLERRGVRIGAVEDRVSDDGMRYEVVVDGRTYPIYDLGADTGDVDTASTWGLAWVRAFELLNELLERAGSQERAYAVEEWIVWFLTPDQFEALRAAIPEPRARPHTPRDEPPWYGQER